MDRLVTRKDMSDKVLGRIAEALNNLDVIEAWKPSKIVVLNSDVTAKKGGLAYRVNLKIFGMMKQ